jgi:heme-degrading monooxygenase HmoA
VRKIAGVQHTLTVWDSREAMQRFFYSGAHKQAIRAFLTMF